MLLQRIVNIIIVENDTYLFDALIIVIPNLGSIIICIILLFIMYLWRQKLEKKPQNRLRINVSWSTTYAWNIFLYLETVMI